MTICFKASNKFYEIHDMTFSIKTKIKAVDSKQC